MDSPPLRKNVQRALNRGENYNQLRRAVSHANFGKLRFKTEEEQELWHECSRLLTNGIILANMTILSQLWVAKDGAGDTAGAALLTRISPVAWQHINFYGRFAFITGREFIDLAAIVAALSRHPIGMEEA